MGTRSLPLQREQHMRERQCTVGKDTMATSSSTLSPRSSVIICVRGSDRGRFDSAIVFVRVPNVTAPTRPTTQYSVQQIKTLYLTATFTVPTASGGGIVPTASRTGPLVMASSRVGKIANTVEKENARVPVACSESARERLTRGGLSPHGTVLHPFASMAAQRATKYSVERHTVNMPSFEIQTFFRRVGERHAGSTTATSAASMHTFFLPLSIVIWTGWAFMSMSRKKLTNTCSRSCEAVLR
mmetsp:Transcript_75451/g.213309  ORF Transcript_75451/g.213309 Transcript_75451/m.213309 type:complete len:242 (+) Transcript_75451:418-1143(+)